MSALYDRLKALLNAGHESEPEGLRDDLRYAPKGKELRGAAVLIAVTDRADPGVLLTHRPLWPCCLNLKGLFMIAPGMAVKPSGFCCGPSFWPCSFSNSGL